MNRKFRPLTVKFILGVFILFLSYFNLYSYVIFNRGDEAFAGNSGDNIIGSCIIDGGGYFLKAYSDALIVLQRIEWWDTLNPDYNELSSALSSAIANMRNANEAYLRLKMAADNTPYNPVFVGKLISFNYNEFQESRALEGNSFNIAKSYLAAGNVRGIFTHLLSGTEQILNLLTDIKTSADAGKFPDLSSLWRVNRLFSETMLAGQYAAEIFYEAGSDN
jgi:hypothetical protein